MAVLSTGQALFDRRCRLTIYRQPTGAAPGGLAVAQVISGEGDPSQPGLRIQFKITKTLEKEPNTCEIRVTNLTASTRQSMQTPNVQCDLEAGYASTGLQGFFSGNVRFVDHVRQKADWETVLKCGDGNTWFQWAQVSGTWNDPISVWAILTEISRQTAIPLAPNPEAQAALSATPFIWNWGYSMSGSAQRTVDVLVKSCGYSWSIQNGQIQVLAPGQSLGNPNQVPLISPATGLIGSPEMGTPEKANKPALCKFKTLLFPAKLGSLLGLQSERYPSAQLRVIKLEHEGDTHSGPWTTTIYGEILKAA